MIVAVACYVSMRHDFKARVAGLGFFTAQEFHFGDFTLDRSRYLLQRGADQLRLEKLPMELLILLVERRGDLVSRDEIAERLWGKDVFLDVDHSINVAVRKIRLVLRDDPEHPRFLETVVGKGYRFAAPVTCNGDSHPNVPPPASANQATVAIPSSVAASPKKPSIWYRNGLLATAIVIVLGAGAIVALRVSETRRAPIKSLAVLPLRNLSGDAGQDYLADGMTEELIGRLASIHELRVISRTSIMRFKDTKLSVPEIANALNVDAVIEGSVIREGNQIRIHAQLIRASTDEHIWAEEYQREYRSVLALQEDIAGAIAERVESTLANRQPLTHVRQIDPDAHEAYLKGLYYFNQRTPEALSKSIGFFNQAIALDPAYAIAYSGLADDYALLGFRGGAPSKDALSRAKAAALKAAELDDKLADAHASLAFIAETYEWDWANAEREYKRALELNPADARAHHWYAGYLVYTGRIDEGIAEEKRARELDPLSLPINNALAGRLLVAGRNDEALDQVKKTLELDPHFPPAHQTLGWIYLNRGQNQDALREFHTALDLSGNGDVDLLLDLGFADAAAGKQDDAREILTKLKRLYDQQLAPPGAIGILYGALGNLDQAFSWLNRACDERDPELTYVKVTGRRFEPLRRDARYADLVRRVGLPQ